MKTVWASEYGDNDLNGLFWRWASREIFGEIKSFGPCATMAVMDGDRIEAVMVYHNYDRRAGVIEISGAAKSPKWLKRHVLREMFSRPFEAMGCQTVCMRVAPDNGDGPRGLQRVLKAYGFVSTVLPNLRGKGRDDVLWTLTDDAWRSNGFHRSTDISRSDEAKRTATA